jgi:peptide/nickel transport system permease protein
LAKFIGRRLIYSVAVLFVTSMIVFGLSRAAGDPRHVFLTEYTSQADWDAWGREYGLDKPFVMQYTIWMSKALRGDFGRSLRDHVNARLVIQERIPATLQLTVGSFILAIAVGLPLGVLSAVKRGTIWDYVGRSWALLGQALPPYWLGVMLVLLFAVILDWLPSGRKGDWTHYVLPAVTLGWGAASGMLRLTRSSMLEVLDSEYIKMARAKGVGTNWIVWKHALKNAIIGPLTYSGLLLGGLLTGTVITETVFSWPGLGRLAVTAVFNNDFPVLTGVVLLVTVIYLSVNLLTDVLYAIIDPRIRLN